MVFKSLSKDKSSKGAQKATEEQRMTSRGLIDRDNDVHFLLLSSAFWDEYVTLICLQSCDFEDNKDRTFYYSTKCCFFFCLSAL